MNTGWAEVALGDICEFRYGRALKAEDRSGTGSPVYGSNGRVGAHDVALTTGPTIVIGRKGSYGQVHYSEEPVWPIDTTYFVDETRTSCDLKWLAYRLAALGLTDLNRAAAVPGLNREDAYRLRLLLPPLDEQQRIAGLLDRAEALVVTRLTSIDQVRNLGHSVFIEMFGDPAQNSKQLDEVMLGDLVLSVSDGPHVSPKYEESGIPFLSTRHVRAGEIDWNDLKYLSPGDADVQWKKCKPRRGDVLYTKGGTTGLAAVVRTDRPFAVWVHVALLRPDCTKVEPVWLESMLNTPYCYAQSQRFTRGIANRDLGLTRLVNIKTFLPPIGQQRTFVLQREAIDRMYEPQRASLAGLQTLIASLRHSAFTGTL